MSILRTFVYDAENKQVEVKNSSNATIGQYFYDGDGKRVKKIVPGTGEVTVFVYSAGRQLAAEYSTDMPQDHKVSYTTADHLGSLRILTDENGATISRRNFHPFGEEIATADRTAPLGYQPDAIRRKSTGYERDNETVLDFAQARMYSYGFGRFTSPDPLAASANPIRPRSWSRYSYSFNNPLRFTDPSGMIVGDFYDEDGNKIGNDANKNDGKIYLVTDKKEREKIRKTKGDYTATVNSAIELPSYDVRQEIGVDAVNRSNSDTFHEEGGTVWQGANGQFAVPAIPGAVSDPLTQQNAQIQVYDPADSNLLNNVDPNKPDVETIYHVHPSGEKPIPKPLTATNEVKIGGSEPVSKNFVQSPSKKDTTLFNTQPKTRLGYAIVVGARDKTVYFYRGSGNRSGCNCIATLPLDKFTSIK